MPRGIIDQTHDTNVREEMETIKKALEADDSYAYSWHANIAMAMYDEMPESATFWLPDGKEQHKICNRAATRFMKNCFGVDTHFGMLDNPPTNQYRWTSDELD